MLLAASLGIGNAQAFVINADVDHGTTYSGLGIVPGDTGTTWNSLSISSSPVSVTVGDGSVQDSEGNILGGVTITMASNDGSSGINRFAADSPSVPNPQDLMRDYSFSGLYDFTITGLPAGKYDLWFFGHGDQNNQAGTVTVDAGNGGGSGSTADDPLGRDLINGGDGISYVYFHNLDVDGGGTLTFQVQDYSNGFQLAQVPEPSLALLGSLGLLGLLSRRRS